MFKATLLFTAKEWKQLKYPSTNEWINKIWYTHSMEYYLATKRNDTLINAVTWMNLENIKLSMRSQAQKATYRMIPPIQDVQNRQIHRGRN